MNHDELVVPKRHDLLLDQQALHRLFLQQASMPDVANAIGMVKTKTGSFKSPAAFDPTLRASKLGVCGFMSFQQVFISGSEIDASLFGWRVGTNAGAPQLLIERSVIKNSLVSVYSMGTVEKCKIADSIIDVPTKGGNIRNWEIFRSIISFEGTRDRELPSPPRSMCVYDSTIRATFEYANSVHFIVVDANIDLDKHVAFLGCSGTLVIASRSVTTPKEIINLFQEQNPKSRPPTLRSP